jgi:hypothetical protein
VNIDDAVSRNAEPTSSPVTAHRIQPKPRSKRASHTKRRKRTYVGARKARKASLDSQLRKIGDTSWNPPMKIRATHPAIRDGVSRGTTNVPITLRIVVATRTTPAARATQRRIS